MLHSVVLSPFLCPSTYSFCPVLPGSLQHRLHKPTGPSGLLKLLGCLVVPSVPTPSLLINEGSHGDVWQVSPFPTFSLIFCFFWFFCLFVLLTPGIELGTSGLPDRQLCHWATSSALSLVFWRISFYYQYFFAWRNNKRRLNICRLVN